MVHAILLCVNFESRAFLARCPDRLFHAPLTLASSVPLARLTVQSDEHHRFFPLMLFNFSRDVISESWELPNKRPIVGGP